MSYQPPQGQPPQQYYAPPPTSPPQHGYPQQHPQQQQHFSPPPQQQQQQHHAPPPPQQQIAHQQQPPPQQQQLQAVAQSDSGQFHGGQYSVTHRDTNAVLNVNLQQGALLRSKSGAMIHMSGTVQLQGKVKFSMRKLFTGGEMSESSYTGPGRVALGPTLFGDIITLPIDGRTNWTIGKDAFLACTADITKESKSQGIGKALFSGEDLFVYRVGGQGLLWLTSFGAVDRLDVSEPSPFLCACMHMFANIRPAAIR